ncbi:ribonuclease Z [Clostridium pasteurianum]|uniref:Ribonuclease Z n=1 Tax=Clostridium pasteurianum BC1 TaxID=86416 RepID=R4K8H6_CLOPA|nr:ribonuclease Z [Clostridium pasteurianum]AGK99472.1 ribonuclease Z [Clostridium pasteurianum BC1]
MLDVCLLGCGGSMPVPNRSLTSMLVSSNGSKLLIDCGEGTQVSMKILGSGFKAIDIICFTHYHADHIAGLPGLLLTIANSGRIEPLTIVGPSGLKKVVEGMTVIAPMLPYELKLIEVQQDFYELKLNDMIIHAISCEHTLPCLGYSVEIKRRKKFNKEKAQLNDVPIKLWSILQKGESIQFGKRVFTPDMVLGDERKGIKICYVTDTRPIASLVDFIKEAELFICEGMYGEDDSLEKAIKNKHMLFSEAAALAKEGNVKELWLTHFSPSLKEPEKYLEHTKKIFDNTIVGKDRLCRDINFT